MRVYILFFLPLKPRLFLERTIPYLNALPANQVTDCPYISGEISLAPITYNNNDTAQFDRNIKQFDHEVSIASEKGDNLLKYLRRYYKEVKTKRQLNLEVPAGWCA
jgi:hypothetical protein